MNLDDWKAHLAQLRDYIYATRICVDILTWPAFVSNLEVFSYPWAGVLAKRRRRGEHLAGLLFLTLVNDRLKNKYLKKFKTRNEYIENFYIIFWNRLPGLRTISCRPQIIFLHYIQHACNLLYANIIPGYHSTYHWIICVLLTEKDYTADKLLYILYVRSYLESLPREASDVVLGHDVGLEGRRRGGRGPPRGTQYRAPSGLRRHGVSSVLGELNWDWSVLRAWYVEHLSVARRPLFRFECPGQQRCENRKYQEREDQSIKNRFLEIFSTLVNTHFFIASINELTRRQSVPFKFWHFFETTEHLLSLRRILRKVIINC